MTFTALHRVLGLAPGPLTDEILNDAVTARVVETDDLDWKSELPPAKGLPQTDYPKDIAAMANSGGGMIIYGVDEDQKAAKARIDTGELSEVHERTLCSVAVSAITPPVFGLEVIRLGDDPRAVAVIVPASVDGPHLIYRGEYFGAPVRNGADTVWMKERQVDAAYRARFDEQRRSTEAVESLYAEAASGRDTDKRAWLIAVAHPRVPGVLARPSRDDARSVFGEASRISLTYANRNGGHPLENLDLNNPRPGLRRWTAPPDSMDKRAYSKQAWASVHHDGSVSLAAAVGARPNGPSSQFEGYEVEAQSVESVIADFTGLVRATAGALGHGEYEVSVGVEWSGTHALKILTVDGTGYTYDGVSTPLGRFTKVALTMDAGVSDENFHRQVYQLAEDCINQGGITHLHVISTPVEET